MGDRLFIYDTTLRDGAQTADVSFTASDKAAIAKALDHLGVDFVEGGWPGANPTDDAFFADPPNLESARLCAFGMMQRPSGERSKSRDAAASHRLSADVITLVGKASAPQVRTILEISPDDNLNMITASIEMARQRSNEVMYDAEHFFDGYQADPDYALACLERAHAAGAQWLVLCDTRGGQLPSVIGNIMERCVEALPSADFGIHAHNDMDLATANTIAAVEAGARQVQGTLNGLGERCGNANLINLLPTLTLKMGYETGVTEDRLPNLPNLYKDLNWRVQRREDPQAPYVGPYAYAHKGGLHGSAVAKDPSAYEHLPPERVGNRRRIIVSNQAGKASLRAVLEEQGLADVVDGELLQRLLECVKAREAKGYAYEAAAESLEVFARQMADPNVQRFRLARLSMSEDWRLETDKDAPVQSVASIDITADREPVTIGLDNQSSAARIDAMLREALISHAPELSVQRLHSINAHTIDLDGQPTIRILADTIHDDGAHWHTVGVSSSFFVAICEALFDAYNYGSGMYRRAGPTA